MSTHVDEILLAGRDHDGDPGTDLYVSEHLSECADCRELERRVGWVDRLLATPEPALPVPARALAPSQGSTLLGLAPRAVVLGLAVIAAVALGSAVREAREDASPAGAPVSAPWAYVPLEPAATLGGVMLGMSGDQVRAVLGDPDRTSTLGVRWEYDQGLTLHFESGPIEDPSKLTSILATTPGIETGDRGVSVGDPEDAFLEIYRDSLRAILRDDGTTTYHVSGPRLEDEWVVLHVTSRGGRLENVLLTLDDSPTFVSPPTLLLPNATASAGQAVAIGPYQVDLGWRAALEDESRRRLDELTFTPLIPDHITFQTTPIVSARHGCGVAPTPCLQFEWYVPNAALRVLQGPAGCCLDAARPSAVRDIEIRPGVFAQLIPVQPAYGGTILWWTESTPSGGVYVAISGTPTGRDELVKIAQSMRPLD